MDLLGSCPNKLYKDNLPFPPDAYPYLIDRGFKVFHIPQEDAFHIVLGDPRGHLDIFSNWNDENCAVVIAHPLEEGDIRPDNWYPADLEDLLDTMMDIQDIFGIYESSQERAARSKSIRVLHAAAVISAQRDWEKRIPARFIDLVLPKYATAKNVSASECRRTIGRGEAASDAISLCVNRVPFDIRINHPLTEEDVIGLQPEVPLNNLIEQVLHIYFDVKGRSNDFANTESSPPQAARYETVRVLRKERDKRVESNIEDIYKSDNPAEKERIAHELRSLPRRRGGSPSDVHRPSAGGGASGIDRADRHGRPWHWQNKRTDGGHHNQESLRQQYNVKHSCESYPNSTNLQHCHGAPSCSHGAEPSTSPAFSSEVRGCGGECQPAELPCVSSPAAGVILSAGRRTPSSWTIDDAQTRPASEKSVQQHVVSDPPTELGTSAKGKERAIYTARHSTPHTFLF